MRITNGSTPIVLHRAMFGLAKNGDGKVAGIITIQVIGLCRQEMALYGLRAIGPRDYTAPDTCGFQVTGDKFKNKPLENPKYFSGAYFFRHTSQSTQS